MPYRDRVKNKGGAHHTRPILMHAFIIKATYALRPAAFGRYGRFLDTNRAFEKIGSGKFLYAPICFIPKLLKKLFAGSPPGQASRILQFVNKL